jgi:two-component system sensor histidine kinase KdpD
MRFMVDEGAQDDLSSLDQAAAAWAMHNGDATGHGTGVMAAAEWSFCPCRQRGAGRIRSSPLPGRKMAAPALGTD